MIDFRFVDGTRLISVVEALIFASEDPIPWDHIAGIIRESEEELKLEQDSISEIIDQINSRYEENDLAFRIEAVGGGYTFVTQPRYHPWLSIFQHENAYRKLSQSAIESLAIVAYRQPITKPEVDQIRGVDSGYILRQLLEKMLIRVAGRADSPGKPLLYKTTDHFLKHFGINSVDELPRPREIDEILKDDEMAEHRRLLMERQMELEEEEADEMIDEFLQKSNNSESEPFSDKLVSDPDREPETGGQDNDLNADDVDDDESGNKK
jgi:segregation and condensation protein B